MPSISRALFISALFLSATASCGDNGGAELGWGTQADADSNGSNPRTVLGFSSKGPFDAAGNPILGVIATNAGFDSSYYAFSAFICGQANPDSYPQTTWGRSPVISASSPSSDTRCLTVSPLGAANATVSLLPCINDISTPPPANQTFEWIGTDFITYGFAFLGTTSGLPVDPSASTDYVPSIVNTTDGTAAYLRLDYVPDGLPASTGKETGLILELSDD
ncbi:hypothetical protein DFH06DRAFT_1143485 [Mycena polygramma]|nr:hypothetical protein DFH06DRAFT_1143485 [Mycena polygramma]